MWNWNALIRPMVSNGICLAKASRNTSSLTSLLVLPSQVTTLNPPSTSTSLLVLNHDLVRVPPEANPSKHHPCHLHPPSELDRLLMEPVLLSQQQRDNGNTPPVVDHLLRGWELRRRCYRPSERIHRPVARWPFSWMKIQHRKRRAGWDWVVLIATL